MVDINLNTGQEEGASGEKVELSYLINSLTLKITHGNIILD